MQHPKPTLVIVPGWCDSGLGHWQTLWADTLPNTVRVRQDDWIAPVREAWVAAIAQTIEAQPGPVVIAAHSLGCIAVSHLPPEVAAKIHGALLVAPADPERRSVLADFAPVPYQRLPYRSVLVASGNDPYCPVRTAGAYARAWGSEFVRLPDAGHINVDAGFGEWPLGLALLQSLGTRVPPIRYLRANQTPNTVSPIPTSARPVSVSPNKAQAMTAVAGGTR